MQKSDGNQKVIKKATWINLSLVAEICSPAAVLRFVTPGGMFLPCDANYDNHYYVLDNFDDFYEFDYFQIIPASWYPAPHVCLNDFDFL